MPTPQHGRSSIIRVVALGCAMVLVAAACGDRSGAGSSEGGSAIGAEPPPPILIDLPVESAVFPAISDDETSDGVLRSAVLALDAASGDIAWEIDVPFSPAGMVTAAGDYIVYTCSCAGGSVVAVMTSTGEPLWIKRSGKWQIRDVAADGDVVAILLDHTRTTTSASIALDITSGETLWITYTDPGDAPTPGGLAITEGTVLLHDAEASVRAIGAATGEELWSARLNAPVGPVSVAGPRVLVPSDGALVELDVVTGEATVVVAGPVAVVDPGVDAIVASIGDAVAVRASSVMADGVPLVGVADLARGEMTWTRGVNEGRFDQLFGTSVQVDVPNGGGNAKHLRGFDVATGEKLWTVTSRRGGVQPGGAAVLGAMTYALIEGELTAIRRNGAIKWAVPVSGIPGTPVVAGNVLVPAADGVGWQGGSVTALNPNNGRQRWATATALPVVYPVVIGDLVVLFTSNPREQAAG